MDAISFIRIEKSLEDAMRYRNSPLMSMYSFFGVQLLPYNIYPYIQRTYNPEGIELEDWTVTVKSICGETLADITPYFEVTRVFQDEDTGLPQIEWQLLNIPFDFGMRLIYFEITQGVNDVMYTNPFVISAENSDFTCRIDYRNNKNDRMLSTQINMYFRQYDSLLEQESYDEIRNRRVSINTKNIEYEVWQTGIIDIAIFRLLKRVFRNRYIYIDLLRTMLFEPFETPRLEASENFSEQELLLIRNEDEVYNPLYIPIVPPTPPVIANIILHSVVTVNNSTVRYSYQYNGFLPNTLNFEFSQDQINWSTVMLPINNPEEGIDKTAQVFVPGNSAINYFYRITYTPLDIVSNVVQIIRPAIILYSIDQGDGNVKYTYIVNGWQPQILDFQFRANGQTTWISHERFNLLPPGEIRQITLSNDNIPNLRYFRIIGDGNIISNSIDQ